MAEYNFKKGQKYLIDTKRSGTTDLSINKNYGRLVTVGEDGRLSFASDDKEVFKYSDVLLRVGGNGVLDYKKSTNYEERSQCRPYNNKAFSKKYTLSKPVSYESSLQRLSMSEYESSFDAGATLNRLLTYRMTARDNGKGDSFFYFVPYEISAQIPNISNESIISEDKEIQINISDLRRDEISNRRWQFWAGRKFTETPHNNVCAGYTVVQGKDEGYSLPGWEKGQIDGVGSSSAEINLCTNDAYLPRIRIKRKVEGTNNQYFAEITEILDSNDPWNLWRDIDPDHLAPRNMIFDAAGEKIYVDSKRKVDFFGNKNDLKKGRAPFDMDCEGFEESEEEFFKKYNFGLESLTNPQYICLDGVSSYWVENGSQTASIYTVEEGDQLETIDYFSLDTIDADDRSAVFSTGDTSSDYVNNFINLYNSRLAATPEPINESYLFVENGGKLYQYNIPDGDLSGYNKNKWTLIATNVLTYSEKPEDGELSDGDWVAIREGDGYKVAQWVDSSLNYLTTENVVDIFTKVESTPSTTTPEEFSESIFDESTADIVDQTEIFLVNDGRGKYTLDLDNQAIILSVSNGQISNPNLLHCKATLYLGDRPATDFTNVTYGILAPYEDDTNKDLYYKPSEGTITIDNNGNLTFNGWNFSTDQLKDEVAYVRVGATVSTNPSEGDWYSARLTLTLNSITSQTLQGQIVVPPTDGDSPTLYTDTEEWDEGIDEWISYHTSEDCPEKYRLSETAGALWILNLSDDTDPNDGLMYLWDGNDLAPVGKLKGVDGEDGISIEYAGEVESENKLKELYPAGERYDGWLFKTKDLGKFFICRKNKTSGIWEWIEMFSELRDYSVSISCSSISCSTYEDEDSKETITEFNPGYVFIKIYEHLGGSVKNVTFDVFNASEESSTDEYGSIKIYAADQTNVGTNLGTAIDKTLMNCTESTNEISLYLNDSSEGGLKALLLDSKESLRVVYTNPFGNVEREDIPINKIVQGSIGPQGPIGQVIRGPRMWKAGEWYYDGTVDVDTSNEEVKIKYIDIVVYEGDYYKCKVKNNDATWNEEKWERAMNEYNFIATGLLLADTAKIGATTTGSVTITGEDDTIHAGIQGPRMLVDEETGDPTTKPDETSVVIWAGRDSDDDPDNIAAAPFFVTYGGHLQASDAEIEGAIRAKEGYIGKQSQNIHISSSGLSTSGFYIKTDGTIYANQMVLGGTSIDEEVAKDNAEDQTYSTPKLYSAPLRSNSSDELEDGDTAVGGSGSKLFGAGNTTQVRVTDAGIEISDLTAASGTAQAGIRGTTSGDDVVFYAGKSTEGGQTHYQFAVTADGHITAESLTLGMDKITGLSDKFSEVETSISEKAGKDEIPSEEDIQSIASSVTTGALAGFTNTSDFKNAVDNRVTNKGYITSDDLSEYAKTSGLGEYFEQALENADIPVYTFKKVGPDSNGVTTTQVLLPGTTDPAYEWKTADGGDYMVFDQGKGTASSGLERPTGNGYFIVSKDGLLTANNAVIYGTIFATAGEFSGYIKMGYNSIGNSATDNWTQQYLVSSGGDKSLTIPSPDSNHFGFTYHLIVRPGSQDEGVTVSCSGTNKFENYALSGLTAGTASKIKICGGHLELTCLGSSWAITQCTGELRMLDSNGSLLGAFSPIYGFSSPSVVGGTSSGLITKIWSGEGTLSITNKSSDTIYIDTAAGTEQ